MRTAAVIICILIWLFHLVVGAGAGWAALRLWDARSHPLVWRLIIYFHGPLIDAITAFILLFMARGVRFTWKFTVTLFIGVLLSDLTRVLLISYVIKGPKHPLVETETSGSKDPDYWKREFREAVREELQWLKEYLQRKFGNGF